MTLLSRSFTHVRHGQLCWIRQFYFYRSVKESTPKINKMENSSASKVMYRTDNIIKSEEDSRLYRGLILENQMKVLLVSDPATDKSAAAMDVNVGYMSDPKEVQGLAHFCEHMLFLGTEKYPSENDYNKFLSEHGGISNAATYPDHTTYYFDVIPKELRNALDRFSQFFTAPLFTESATEREINAVNSEHEKNIPCDSWRKNQLDKHLAESSHPYHGFGTGNRLTLDTLPKQNNISVRNELLKFHDQWYSANIMCLAILGKESLEELEEIVVNLFSSVANKNVEAPHWDVHPFNDQHFGTFVYVCPIKDVRSLNIIFPCSDLQKYYKSAPAHFISHLMGHEGPGSILSVLKALGWSNHLVAGNMPAPRGIGFFGITVDLTEEGIKHMDDIIELIFKYIEMLKTNEPLKWIQDENSSIGNMLFRFKDKETPREYISILSHMLQEYEIQDVLSGMYIYSEWRPDLVVEIWQNFVPEKIRVIALAKQFENTLDQVEPWYGTKYKVTNIPEDTLTCWRNSGLSDEFKLPNKNDFIPTDFQLYPVENDVTEHPVIIQDSPLCRVWFKQDDFYHLPKANAMFEFASPLVYLDPINCNLTHMLVQLFRDSLNEYAYDAELAGLKWELMNTKYGIILGIGGYNNKQHVFLDKIMEKLTNFKIDRKRFEIYKETYIRSLKNFSAEQPYQHAVYYVAVLLSENAWTKQELLDAMDQVTVEKLEAYVPQILSKIHIECLIHGNCNKETALKLVQVVEDRLLSSHNVSHLLPRQLLLNRELKLENGCNYVYEVNNDFHRESCIELYYQSGLQTKENTVKLECFAQIIQEPCFNILRTKEQLGYIVFSGIRRSNGAQGLRIIVQSNKHPTFLNERIEEFLHNILGYIENLPEDEFLRHKEALAARKLEKPKQLSLQTHYFWDEIAAQQYHFDRANVDVAYLRTLNKDDIVEFGRNLLSNMEKRKKLAVHVMSTVEQHDISSDTKLNTNFDFIRDVTVFKSNHGMYPLVQPYINIPRKGNKCKL